MTEFGEDLPALANRAYALALEFCGSCANYHIYWPARRAAGIVGGSDADRNALIGNACRLARSFASGPDRKFDILIAGAADTGILAAIAEGVNRAGGRNLLHRTRFCIVDLCRTPLQLCLDYGEERELDVSVECADLSSFSPFLQFDLITAHSVLAFFPPPARSGVFARMAGWLSADGRLLYSANMANRTRRERERRFETVILPSIRSAVVDGRIVPPESETVFLDRCRKRHSGVNYDRKGFSSRAQLQCLAHSAGLEIEHMEMLQPGAATNGSTGSRPRLIAAMRVTGNHS